MSHPVLPEPVSAPIRNDLERAYRKWRQAHPSVYALYVRFAKQAMTHKKPFSISLLTERVRWEVRETWEKDEEGFKLNNNHRAYISRDLIADMPELAGVLELRSISSEEASSNGSTGSPSGLGTAGN